MSARVSEFRFQGSWGAAQSTVEMVEITMFAAKRWLCPRLSGVET
jgi:hypothetical protein